MIHIFFIYLMDIIEQYSALHKQLQLKEYDIPIQELYNIKTQKEFFEYCKYFQIENNSVLKKYIIKFMSEIKSKEEFIEYIKFFEIEKSFLLKQILNCQYLEYLHEYMKDDIEQLLIHEYSEKNEDFINTIVKDLNDENLRYISQYIKIVKFNVNENQKITTIEPFANTLKVLYAYGSLCHINDKSLINCNNLEELFVWNNPNITTVEPFAKTLKILVAMQNSGINDNGLKNCTNLEKLYAHYNSKITTVEPFANTLKILHANGSLCGIDDNGLKNCNNLEVLNANDNIKITTIEPFIKTLKRLYANDNCGIGDNSLKNAINLEFLHANNNSKITAYRPLSRKLYVYNEVMRMWY